jgi:hypothetical protein
MENDAQYWGAIRPMALWAQLGPATQAAWPAHTVWCALWVATAPRAVAARDATRWGMVAGRAPERENLPAGHGGGGRVGDHHEL